MFSKLQIMLLKIYGVFIFLIYHWTVFMMNVEYCKSHLQNVNKHIKELIN